MTFFKREAVLMWILMAIPLLVILVSVLIHKLFR